MGAVGGRRNPCMEAKLKTDRREKSHGPDGMRERESVCSFRERKILRRGLVETATSGFDDMSSPRGRC